MRVPLDWLRDYVRFDVEPHVLAHDLTMLGTKIESVDLGTPGFEGVFVGKVLECRKHPHADKLTLCQVAVGDEELSIVCGAPNVRPGLTVAVARPGARLAGDLRIRKSKIRGETSEGMICSARELGLGEDRDGILELDAALASGATFTAGARGAVLEAEITPNRPDCLALLGVAREVAALYEQPLRLPPVWAEPARRRERAPLRVEIEAPEDCGRYFGRALRGVQIAASPPWLQERIVALGLEPINNVVDVTNYVLFETGQPIHAFDLAALRGGRLLVRRGRAGETLQTLDGVERRLEDILVIADGEGPVALAGIMGGLGSAVRASTADLFLEAAYFRPDLVRSGRRRLGLDTDASYRFERQTDIEAVRWVMDRVTHLLLEVAGGEVREASEDVYPRQPAPRRLRLRAERASLVVGVTLEAERCAALLRRLHLDAVARGGSVDVQVPSFRRDLHEEIDLVEEVARMHGYDNIPSDALPPAALQPRPHRRQTLLARLRQLVVGLGYFEVRTSAFMERRDPERLGLGAGDVRRRAVCLRNPIVPTLDTMRTTMLPGMLRVLRHNLNRESTSLRLAAVDRVFLDLPGDVDGLPQEPERLLLLACGASHPESWGEAARRCDVFDLKGDAEALLEHLGVDTVWSRGYTEPFLDDGVSFLISGSYGVIGGGGGVRAEVLQSFDVEIPVFVLELDVAALEQHLPARRAFRGIPRFPAVKRDLSLVLPRHVAYENVRRVAVEAGGAWLESVHCFDVFEDRSLGEGVRSVGLRLRFRSPERTLLDDMVEPWMDGIVRRLEASLGVRLRTL